MRYFSSKYSKATFVMLSTTFDSITPKSKSVSWKLQLLKNVRVNKSVQKVNQILGFAYKTEKIVHCDNQKLTRAKYLVSIHLHIKYLLPTHFLPIILQLIHCLI